MKKIALAALSVLLLTSSFANDGNKTKKKHVPKQAQCCDKSTCCDKSKTSSNCCH